MHIHIGKAIKDELESQGRSKVWLAKKINRTVATLYHIFQCETIDTGLLELICKALGRDFFKELSDGLDDTHRPTV